MNDHSILYIYHTDLLMVQSLILLLTVMYVEWVFGEETFPNLKCCR